MKNKRFIVLNILATFLEISLILIIIIISTKDNPVLRIVCLSLYLIYLLLMLRVSFYKKAIFNTIDFPEDLEGKVNAIYNRFRNFYPDTEVTFHYVKDKNFIEPAAYLEGKIYINSNYKFSDVFLSGIIGHELGHAKSKLIKYKLVHLLRITSVFSRQIYAFRYMNRKIFDYPIMKQLDYLLMGVYNIFSLMDHLVSFPYYRADEIYANSVAVKIGYGESLRYFYYNSILNTQKDIRFIISHYDYKHPSTEKMIDLIEEEMNLDSSEIDVFAVNNKIQTIRNADSIKSKNEKIMNWYRYKESEDNEIIYYDLGLIYLRGKYGCDKDISKSKYYFAKAKDLDFYPAIYELALLNYNDNLYELAYDDLEYLVTKDFEKAYIYYALCLAYGHGTEENPITAYKYFSLAGEQKNSLAKNYLMVMNKTVVYSSQSNNDFVYRGDKFIFKSVNEVIRVDELENESRYSLKIHNSFLSLLDENMNEYIRLYINKNGIIRKNVLFEIEEEKHFTDITYKIIDK